MEEENNNELGGQTSGVAGEGDPSPINQSIDGDFTTQSQWALVPQNTLITFQTLPFNLGHIDDTSEVIGDIEQTTHIPSIHDVDSKLEESLATQNRIEDVSPETEFPSDQPVSNTEQGSIQENFTPEIFTKISATLSSALLDAIPGSHSVIMEAVQTQVGTHLNIESEKEYTIIGSIQMLLHVHNKLQAMMPFSKKTRLALIEEDNMKEPAARMENKGSNCNLLVPLVSSHGREVHQPVRYSGCLQLGDVGQDDEEYRPRRHKRNRKMLQPRKTAHNEEAHNSRSPNQIIVEDKVLLNRDSKQRGNYKKNYELRTPFRYFCKMCSFKTKRESHLNKHMLLHDKNMRLYPCSQCSFVAIRYSVMRRHEITHSGHGHQCEKCPYKADNAKLLLRHKRIKHTSKNDFCKAQLKCLQCNYRTSQEVMYERHLQVHMSTTDMEGNNLTFHCTECEYKTNRKEHYIRHRANVHGNSRPYLCDLCGMAFKRPDTLAQHKLTHKDRKDRNFAFHCKDCGKGFRSQAHLTEHSTMHSSDRPYLCDHCGASFKTQNVQKKHIQTIHLNPRSYNCDKCSKSFNTKYALRRHVRIHDTSDVHHVGTVTMGPLVSGDHLPSVDVNEQTALVQDVMTTSIEESYEQTHDGLRQAYSVIPTNETTTALLYLTGNLQL